MELAGLRASIAAGRVAAVEVSFVPYEAATRSPVTSELLREMAYARSVRKLGVTDFESLLAAIDATHAKPSQSDEVDLRWGALFLGRDHSPLHSVFLCAPRGREGRSCGVVDGDAVEMSFAIWSWFETGFAETMIDAQTR